MSHRGLTGRFRVWASAGRSLALSLGVQPPSGGLIAYSPPVYRRESPPPLGSSPRFIGVEIHIRVRHRYSTFHQLVGMSVPDPLFF